MNIPIEKVKPLSFRIKKFDYNRYRIDHPDVQGILNLGNVVNAVGKVPDSEIPAEQVPPEGIVIGVGYQAIVSFTNQGKKHNPPSKVLPPQDVGKAKKTELTDFITDENNFEPWNEYVLADNPPKLMKTKTILMKVEWVVDHYNNLGDPYLWVNHDTSHTVSDVGTHESGMS